MCGITGIVHFNRDRRVDEKTLIRMSDTLSHRGPDGSGIYISENLGLGHRRLSIIDLNTGDQPQYNDNKSLAIVFNGEIYNYVELREELKILGHHFRTNSDTEVIIRAYEQWGIDCQKRFNGMWAFALWDERNQRLFISRDRLGEKPLYYAIVDDTFLFGSEIKAILAYGISFKPNFELTELFLSLGYIPAPYSFYKNIYKLHAGSSLIVRDNYVTETKYWDIPNIEEANITEDKQAVYERFEELFSDSVRIRMRSDVPFGAFLSGGLDSASVVAAMTRVSSAPVHTYTIGFEDAEYDERSLAGDVAKRFTTSHTELVVKPDSFTESLNRVLHHFDEPFGDSSAIPTGYVSKMAAGHVRMVLTGDGGDEVLSGYNSYQIEKFASLFQRGPDVITTLLPKAINPFANISKGFLRYKLNRLKRILEYSTLPFESRLMIKSSWCPPQYIKQLVRGAGEQMSLKDFVSDFFNRYKAHDPFYKLMQFHLKVQLPDDFLVKVDRMSMAYSLETRVPFLDHRLVEFMISASKKVKMNGFERKSVLRNSIGRQLPKSLLRASKKGFTPPMREWFKSPSFDEQLASLSSNGFLDAVTVRKIVNENRDGKADWGNLIWILIVLNAWEKSNG